MGNIERAYSKYPGWLQTLPPDVQADLIAEEMYRLNPEPPKQDSSLSTLKAIAAQHNGGASEKSPKVHRR